MQVWLLPDDANTKRICLLPGNRRDESVVGWRSNTSLYHTAPGLHQRLLSTVVLTIAYHGHRHRYGTSDIPADENR